MNKTITVNISGAVFNIEEEAYEAIKDVYWYTTFYDLYSDNSTA